MGQTNSGCRVFFVQKSSFIWLLFSLQNSFWLLWLRFVIWCSLLCKSVDKRQGALKEGHVRRETNRDEWKITATTEEEAVWSNIQMGREAVLFGREEGSSDKASTRLKKCESQSKDSLSPRFLMSLTAKSQTKWGFEGQTRNWKWISDFNPST